MSNPLRFLFFLAVILFAQKGFSQGQIKGRIIDSLHQKPVEYASISLYKAEDNKFLHGQLTDSLGNFAFNGLKAGPYVLKVELIGYKSKSLNTISLNKNQVLDLGILSVQSNSALLDEVVVTGKEDEMAYKMDKQVYKAEQFQSAKGGTAIDVLRNMPSVTVGSQDEIRLRGSTSFMVLVNGKPVVADAYTVLSQIPANAVENIEIITSPSAKYDADGKAGIINITTKKGTNDGLSFTVNGNYGLPSVDHYDNKKKPKRYGFDATINYKKDKWDLSFGGSYQQNDLAGQRDGDVNTTISNRFTSFPSLGERSFERRNYNVRASATFTANKQNVFSAGIYRGQRRQYRVADIVYHNTTTDVNTGQVLNTLSYYNANTVKKQGDFTLANLDYTHTFENKSSLSLSGLYEDDVLDGFTKNLNTGLTERQDTIEYVLNTGNSPIQGLRLKADYSTTIGKGKWESGYQFRYQSQTGTYLYQQAVLGTGQMVVVPQFSDNIDIQNRIHGLYTQYAAKADKLEYQVGLRYEYSTRVFDADKFSQPDKLVLSNFFPSANALYSLDKGWKAKAGFSSRVQRSTNNELNPYPEREHSETMEQGDPTIKPEFVYVSELGIVKEFKQGSVFGTFYNQQIRNVVNRVNSVFNDTVLNRIYTNAGNAVQWGFESGLNIKPVKWWTAYLGGQVYDYSIKGSLFQQTVTVNNKGWVYSINTSQTFQLAKIFSMQFNLNYLSQRPTAQGEDSRYFIPTLSFKKTFWKDRLTATFQWQNISAGILPTNEQRITTRGSDFYTTTNYIQEKDILMLNLGYNFKAQNKKVKLPSSEFGEKEF